MENAVDALKIAFAVFIFGMAITITVFMFSEVKETADILLQSSDVTEYMDYTEVNDITDTTANDGTERIVGIETIIPTLYKYYKENYTVIFLDRNGSPLELYETQTNSDLWSADYINKYYGTKDLRVCSFDVDEETSRHEPWTGSNQDYKENLDHFLQGGQYSYNVSWNNTGSITYDYGNGFIREYQSERFVESLGEYVYSSVNTAGTTVEREKRVIIYTLY